MLINQNNIAILKKDALQKLRIIFYVTMAIVFCFALQAGADEKNDIGATTFNPDEWDLEGTVGANIKAAEQGNADVQTNLGFMYHFGEGVPQDYKKAVYWYTKAAEQDNAGGQYFLGLMYKKGEGVPQDYKKAVYWFTKAAEQGNAWAQFSLGLMHDTGQGVPQDYKKAVYWYTKAAEQGDAYAQYNLGIMYYNGQGVPQDYKKAAYWYTKAVEQGFAMGQFRLGWMYNNGQGVPQDYKKAVYWYTKAAEQGIPITQCLLGIMYDLGQGVPQDYKKAVYWFTKSAEQGFAMGQFRLGWMYNNGQGVPQDYITAYAWWNLSAASGDKDALNNRGILSRKMTRQQIAKAQALSVKFQNKIDRANKQSDSNSTASKTSELNEQEIKSLGTGFFISRNGYILTCHHVIDGAESIKVIAGGKSYPAQLIRDDKYNDLSLLKVSGRFSALAFSSKRSARMGQEVFTVGYPNPSIQGVGAKLTKGTVNSLTGFMDDLRLYQISVPVQPGNSGGPLLDMNGNVTGIIVAVLDAKAAFKITGSLPQNVNYALKSTYAQALLDTLPKISKKLPHPYKHQPFDKVVDRIKKSVVMVITYD